MKILFLGINYWPEETGIAVFNTGRCEYLAARGHELTMCTGMPYYPQWRIATGYRHKPFASEIRNGVRILRSWLYVPRRVTSVRRILHEGSFIATATMRALGVWRPEILVVAAPPLGLAIPAILLSRLWRIPYVFHVEDLQPDAAIDLGLLGPAALPMRSTASSGSHTARRRWSRRSRRECGSGSWRRGLRPRRSR